MSSPFPSAAARSETRVNQIFALKLSPSLTLFQLRNIILLMSFLIRFLCRLILQIEFLLVILPRRLGATAV
jgi:hypothetical protein